MAGKITLKITLSGIKPPVWRRIEVPASFTFKELYLCIQAAMGWQNCHLSEFHANGKTVTQPDFEPEGEFLDSTKTKLLPMLGNGSKFEYWYDFGDDWYHVVEVESIEPSAALYKPACTGGARACPPEDVGGICGYGDFLAAIADPNHEEHRQMLDWAGGKFDPEEFNLKEANRQVSRYKEMEEG